MRGGKTKLPGINSQWLSPLLITGALTPEGVTVMEDNLMERPYVDMTMGWIRQAGGSVTHDRYEKFTVSLRWTESGGPAVSVPRRRGFGSIVVETMPRMELDAEAELQYAPEGLRWHLDCPAETVLETGDDPPAFRMIAQ